ncbi:MAG: Holliday junction resolvase RuvX [Propionibacteriaceae bacterium]|nr:Holliday junction resolvase RuvX [Propionibacteriaceae bacterium]
MAEERGVLLAIDLGSARVGVAACDQERILAYPLEVIPADSGVEERIVELVGNLGAVGLIIGYPLTLDGQVGIAASKVADIAARLAAKVAIPVWLVDERLSTAQAHKRLRAAGRNAKKARPIVDSAAAVGILESVLAALERGQTIGQAVTKEDPGV